MLVEGRVVHTRREHDHRRVLHRRRCGAAERVDEARRVVRDHLNGLAPEQFGQHPGHGGSIRQHVAHSRRAAQVVLQHAELPVLVADHIDARHVDADPVGGRVAVGGAHEARRAGDHVVRDESVAHDAGRPVDVGQEELEGPNALCHPCRDLGPLGPREDARHHVEGERALLAIEVERHALVHEGPGQPGTTGRDVLGAHLGQGGGDRRIGRSRRAVAVHHLVEGDLGQPTGRRAVAVKEVSHGPQGARPVFRWGFTVANSR
jgi:hypothetical protein